MVKHQNSTVENEWFLLLKITLVMITIKVEIDDKMFLEIKKHATKIKLTFVTATRV